MLITTFWVQGHGVREFVGAAGPGSSRHQELENRAVAMAATIAGAWTTLEVEVPEEDLVEAFSKVDPVV